MPYFERFRLFETLFFTQEVSSETIKEYFSILIFCFVFVIGKNFRSYKIQRMRYFSNIFWRKWLQALTRHKEGLADCSKVYGKNMFESYV